MSKNKNGTSSVKRNLHRHTTLLLDLTKYKFELLGMIKLDFLSNLHVGGYLLKLD